MIVDEILADARRYLDDEVQPYLWSDATLYDGLNAAIDEACERTRVIQDSTSSACSITLVAGTARYTLNPAIFAVRRARVSGQRYPLKLVNARQLDDLHPGWDDTTLTDNGTPEYAVFDLGDGTITLHPRPSEAGTLSLTVWRRPTEAERIEYGDGDAEPAIPERQHRELVHFVLFRAFTEHDREKNNPEKAATHLALFTAAYGEKPSLHAMRQWSTSRITGTKAHYY